MKSRSYKNKNIILLAGTIMFLIIFSFYFFKTTWHEYQEKARLEVLVAKASTAPENIIKLTRQADFLERAIGGHSAAGSREKLLDKVSHYCKEHSVILKEFPSISLQNESGIKVETNVVIAEGKFHDLLSLVYYIEIEEKLGRPVSVTFSREFDQKIKKEVLVVKIFLQTIKLNEKDT